MIMGRFRQYLPISTHDHETPHPASLWHVPFAATKPANFLCRPKRQAQEMPVGFLQLRDPKRRMPGSLTPSLTRRGSQLVPAGGRPEKLTNNNISINLAFNS